ncbi:MAG TPA: hypothetical protein VJB60_04180 [Candidatus Peribacterales bacterium]|nr:hypothetical protein [Candidatus Peribacterales bacterium]
MAPLTPKQSANSKAKMSAEELRRLQQQKYTQAAAVASIRVKLHGYRTGIEAAVTVAPDPKVLFVHVFDGAINDVRTFVPVPEGIRLEFLDNRMDPEGSMVAVCSPVSSKPKAEPLIVPITGSGSSDHQSLMTSASVPVSVLPASA